VRTVGVRELRQQASKLLRQVEHGLTFQVTDRGRPVALLTPLPRASLLERLRDQGDLAPATHDLGDLAPPAPVRRGQPRPSAVLKRLRADER